MHALVLITGVCGVHPLAMVVRFRMLHRQTHTAVKHIERGYPRTFVILSVQSLSQVNLVLCAFKVARGSTFCYCLYCGWSAKQTKPNKPHTKTKERKKDHSCVCEFVCGGRYKSETPRRVACSAHPTFRPDDSCNCEDLATNWRGYMFRSAL